MGFSGPRGATGPQGAVGPVGAAGAAGKAGAAPGGTSPARLSGSYVLIESPGRCPDGATDANAAVSVQTNAPGGLLHVRTLHRQVTDRIIPVGNPSAAALASLRSGGDRGSDPLRDAAAHRADDPTSGGPEQVAGLLVHHAARTDPGFMFHVFGALAEFERELIRERKLAGLAAARARGRVGGRPPV